VLIGSTDFAIIADTGLRSVSDAPTQILALESNPEGNGTVSRDSNFSL
jgi:hypothetical protein